MKDTKEIKRSPPHLLKKFAGNMEETLGAVCMESLAVVPSGLSDQGKQGRVFPGYPMEPP